MTVLEGVALGLLQGLTEILPVSSSGHLLLGQAALGIEIPGFAFEVVVHVATMCAITWVFRARLVDLARGVRQGDRGELGYLGLLILGSVPAAIVGIGFRDTLAPLFERPMVAAALLVVTGFVVLSIRWTGTRSVDARPSVPAAVLIGVAQAFAILPGISRSGSTVAAATALGITPRKAAEFSFLLSLPAVGGAAVLQIGGFDSAIAEIGVGPLIASFVTAIASGVFAIHLCLRLLGQGQFHRFAPYCWLVGGGFLVASIFLPELR